MKSRWKDADLTAHNDELDQLVYLSRLLGEDHSLVLLGGGNTSAKVRERNLYGEEEDILYVKGSGTSLEDANRDSFSPVRLQQVLPLLALHGVSTPVLLNAFSCAMTCAKAPTPSIETLLHALLPFPFVTHTHADSLLAVGNTEHGEERIRTVYGDEVLIVPFRSSGFDLAQCCAEAVQQQMTSRTIGIVLMNHGIFAFGATAREAYERMIALVSRAEDHLKANQAWKLPEEQSSLPRRQGLEIADLRRAICRQGNNRPFILTVDNSPTALAFARRPDVADISQQGPATPHHAIFTKRVPMLGRDVVAYGDSYRHYLSTLTGAVERIDGAPRIVLDPELGLCAIGVNAFYADAAAEVYRHTIDIISRASALDRYRALPAGEILAAEVEYGGFEHKVRGDEQRPLSGQIVLVAEAASPFGQACSHALLARGAAVVGLDKARDVATLFPPPSYLGIACDTQAPEALADALEMAARRYGGVDHVVAPANFPLMQLQPLLALSPVTNRIVLADDDSKQLEQALTKLVGQGRHANAVLLAGNSTEAGAKLVAEMCGHLFKNTSNSLIKINI
ncbi:MAG: class II aldolase/adducin family protein [Sulfuricellaceae bacterium]|jgi:rhamnose utilization protein RhaD (predicted bifunctional aldolase and dehydrogenase)